EDQPPATAGGSDSLQRVFGNVSQSVRALDRVLQQRHNLPLDALEVALQGAASGVAMSTAAELLRNLGDVYITFRAQAGAINAGRTLFEKRCCFDFSDRQRIVNESVGVFFRSARLFLHLQRLFHPGDMTRLVTLRGREDQA